MSCTLKQPNLSDKGLLTPDNCVVAFIDRQPRIVLAGLSTETCVTPATGYPVAAQSAMLKWQRHRKQTGNDKSVMDIITSHAGCYGTGAESAITMIGGETKMPFPSCVVN